MTDPEIVPEGARATLSNLAVVNTTAAGFLSVTPGDAGAFGAATIGLRGWRSSVADAVATPVAKRSSVGEDQVRAVVGAVFLVLSLMYVVGAVKDLFGDDR